MRQALFILTIIFSSVASYGQGWEWAKSGGNINGNTFSHTVATDGAGNIYVAGAFSTPSLVFGNIVLSNFSINFADFYIVKYDPQGNIIWATKGGNFNSETAYSITADNIGNIYVCGTFQSDSLVIGSSSIYNTTNFSEPQFFIAKYDTAGNPVWLKGGGSSGRPYGVTTDNANNIYVAGEYGGVNQTFGSLNFSTAGAYDIFLLKYNPQGDIIWGKSIGSTGGEGATSVHVDLQGDLYVGSFFSSPTISIDAITLTKSSLIANSLDMMLVKYDTSGNALWAKNALCGSWGNDFFVTTDGVGDVYITCGYSQPTVVYGTTTLPHMGQQDVVLAKYNSSGGFLWAKGFGGAQVDHPCGVVCDDHGNVYVAGGYSSTSMTVGSNNLVNAGSFDLFLVKYNASSGNITEAITVGADKIERPYDIARDPQGNIYFAGIYNADYLDFGGQTIYGDTNNRYYMSLAKWSNPYLGISEYTNDANITIYPNPAYDQINIETTLSNHNLSLINTLGQVVYTKGGCNSRQAIDISQLVNSIYYLRIEAVDKTVVNKKVLVQH